MSEDERKELNEKRRMSRAEKSEEEINIVRKKEREMKKVKREEKGGAEKEFENLCGKFEM